MIQKNNDHSQLINFIIILHGFVLLLLIAYLGQFLFIPLFFSFLIAVFLYPLCAWFEKHGLNRLSSSMLCVLILLIGASLILFFVSSQFSRFLKDVPSLQTALQMLIQDVQGWLHKHFNIDESTQLNYVNSSIDGFLNAAKFTLTSFLTIIIFITLAFFFVFYMLLYRKMLEEFIISLFSHAYWKTIIEITYTLQSTILGYIKGLLTEIFILMFLSGITLAILGVKYAILMAFFAGLFNIIPYIGIYTATLINMLITVIDGDGNKTFIVLLVFIIIHILDSNIITPVIVGRRVKINPLVTLIAVIAGELIWGIPGMFLFIPLAGIINIIFEKSNNNEEKEEPLNEKAIGEI